MAANSNMFLSEITTEQICDKNNDNEKYISVGIEKSRSNLKLCSRLFWKVISGLITSLCHISIGIITFVSCWYALKTVDIKPLTSTQKHIMMCVIGLSCGHLSYYRDYYDQYTCSLLNVYMIGLLVLVLAIFLSSRVITFVSCWYALKTVDIKPLTSTQKHIMLCVIGYQLLMAEAILAFNNGNSWAQTLTARDKKLAHWLLQVAGGLLAIAGSILKMVDKTVNFTSTHGIIGFVAMLLTCISLINGLSALYAYELRRLTKPRFLKLAHVVSGTFAFVLASVCLCYGFDKTKFREWASPGATSVVIALCGFNTCLVICNPLISVFRKLSL